MASYCSHVVGKVGIDGDVLLTVLWVTVATRCELGALWS